MIDGIYVSYLTGIGGQSILMFVFRDGHIAGADMQGVVFSGVYQSKSGRVTGSISYSMPGNSTSITGLGFEQPSGIINVPIDLPVEIDAAATYRIETPIGPVNARFKKLVSFGGSK